MTRLTFHVVLPSVLLAVLCHAGPAAPNAAKTAPPAAKDSASASLEALSGLGKGQETEKSLENSLVSRLKKRDPFQLPIRGKYRGVVEPVEQRPPQQVAQAPVTTFAQAIDHLPVRGIDVASRELLIGSRCLTEGDLLKIEFNGQPFTAWVRSVGKEAITFVNAELTETVQKTIASGPRDLDAMESVRSLLPSGANRQSFSNSELIPVSDQESRSPAPARQGRLQADQQDVYRLQDYPINELFEFLARKAGLQYFFNPAVNEVRVTGELSRQMDPMESMQELAVQYNLAVYQRGRTIYLITPEQNF